jgi:hypothetical protein
VLTLWVEILAEVPTGINLKLLTVSQPTNIIITDACSNGMGGFSISSVKAWRVDLCHLSIPDNNELEFMASVVGVLQCSLDKEIPLLGKVLVLVSNSSGLCWLHRNNFDQDQKPIHAEIASKLALTCIRNDFTIIHSHHIGEFPTTSPTHYLENLTCPLRQFIFSPYLS